MYYKRLVLIIIGTLSFRCIVSQSLYPYYTSPYSFIVDNNKLYTVGMKLINQSNKNQEPNGFYHNSDLYISKFDLKGKKEWEIVLDKKREFNKVSEIVKYSKFFYTLLEVKNFKPESSISYYWQYLIRFDSLGNIVEEKILNDSTFYSYSNITYSKEFIYVTKIIKNEMVCQKYDYSFHYIESIKNDVQFSLFFDSKVVQINQKFIGIGPMNNIDEIRGYVNTNSIKFYRPSNYCAKTMGISKAETKLRIYPLPLNEVLYNVYSDSKIISISTWDKSKEKIDHCKLFTFDPNKESLKLVTDTLTRLLSYSKIIADNSLLFVTNRITNYNDKTKSYDKYPEVVYFIKNNKLVTSLKLVEFIQDHGASFFRVINDKLYVFTMFYPDNSIQVKVLDYKTNSWLQ